jgi:hypothetical protein
VRNAEDGTVTGWDPATLRTPFADVAMRAKEPHGRCFTSSDVRRNAAGRTLQGSEAHERMKPFAQASGGRRPVKTAVLVGNGEVDAGAGNPMSLPAERTSIL